MIADSFKSEFASIGYSTEIRDGDTLYFPPLDMTLTFERLYTKDSVTCLKVSVSKSELLPNGLFELAFGQGDNQREQDNSAASGWITIDFPAIHAYLCKSGNDLNVKRIDMVSQTGDQQIGWNILLGPMSHFSDHEKKLPEDIDLDLVKCMLNTITGKLNTPQLLSLKLFVSKFSDGKVSADCRLNGEPWIEGTNDLYIYSDGMELGGKVRWLKQFIIIYPRKLDELKSPGKMSQDVSERYAKFQDEFAKQKSGRSGKKRWFEFWKD